MKPYGRAEWLNRAIDAFHKRRGKIVVELGSMRNPHGLEGDGHSTVAWAQNAAEVYTVDIDQNATALAREATREFGSVEAITRDAIEFLRDFKQPIDLLYLDAWDAHSEDSPIKHLAAYVAARKNLHRDSIILIDDTDVQFSKCKLVIPAAERDGYFVVFTGKQTMLVR